MENINASKLLALSLGLAVATDVPWALLPGLNKPERDKDSRSASEHERLKAEAEAKRQRRANKAAQLQRSENG